MKKRWILPLASFLCLVVLHAQSTDLTTLKQRAQQGDATAQLNLGIMYDIGQGVPQDFGEAAKWYRLAADQGDVSAQTLLAIMYNIGQGVPQDYVEAHKWFNLAVARGNEAARKPRDLIAEKMTPAQIYEAQTLARNWKPKK
jgi:TPR repeat protein